MTIRDCIEPVAKAKFRYIFSVLLTALLVYLLLSNMRASDIKDTLRNTEITFILYGFLTYILMNFFRVLRFRIILGSGLSMRELFSVVTIHNMYNNLVPARLGEISFFYLLKKRKRPVEDAISALFIARVSDFVVIYLFFFVSFLLCDRRGQISTHILNTVVILFAFALVVCVCLLLFQTRISGGLRRFFSSFRLDRFRMLDVMTEKLSLAVNNVRKFESARLFPVLLYSILIWASSFLVYFVLMTGMGIHLNFWNITLGSSITVLITTLPIGGIGGFGTVEGAWTMGYMLAGLSMTEAILTGFSIHILRIVFLILLGALGYALSFRRRENQFWTPSDTIGVKRSSDGGVKT